MSDDGQREVLEPGEPYADRPVQPPPEPKKEKQPLNPAYAILVGAVLSAVAGLSATFLNIRSSERLSNEKEKAAAAATAQAEERTRWEAEVADLQAQLDVANRRIETLIGNTVPTGNTTVTAAPLPSIVVVLPTNPAPPAPAASAPTSAVTQPTAAATTQPPATTTTTLPSSTTTSSTTSTSRP